MTWESKLGWTDVIAIYAAVVATAVLLWDWWKWKHSGPTLRIEAKPDVWHEGVQLGYSGGYYIDVMITNTGDRPTTVEELQMTARNYFGVKQYYGHQRSFFPVVLEPGKVHKARVHQTQLYVKLSDKAKFYVGVKHSHAKRAQRVRVRVTKPELTAS